MPSTRIEPRLLSAIARVRVAASARAGALAGALADMLVGMLLGDAPALAVPAGAAVVVQALNNTSSAAGARVTARRERVTMGSSLNRVVSLVIRPRHRKGLLSQAIRSATSSVSRGVGLFSLSDRAADAALVSALAVNDEAAATAFVRRFQGPVFGLAVSITRDRVLAEDVAQEAFLRAWRASASYDSRRGSVLTWLLTITRNLAIDAIRARRAAPVEAGELELLISTSVSGSAPDGTGGRVEALAAADRLARLPLEQARAVVLAVIGGRTGAEVAEHEGIPLGTAKTRIRNGLLRMRLAMEAERD